MEVADMIHLQWRSGQFSRGTRRESGEQKSPAGSKGRAPVGPPAVEDKYGCRLHRNAMKNAKNTTSEINT